MDIAAPDPASIYCTLTVIVRQTSGNGKLMSALLQTSGKGKQVPPVSLRSRVGMTRVLELDIASE